MTSDKWAEKLINSRYRELPMGYARISTQQILQADKRLSLSLPTCAVQGFS